MGGDGDGAIVVVVLGAECVRMLELAIEQLKDNGRINMAAKYYKEIAEIYEQQGVSGSLDVFACLHLPACCARLRDIAEMVCVGAGGCRTTPSASASTRRQHTCTR